MSRRSHSLLSLALSSLGITLLWCIVLPWLSARPLVRERLEFLEQRGIDPSAMFYTELEAMDAILERLEGRQNLQNDAPAS